VKGPREASIVHGLRVAQAHGVDARFTVPRMKVAVEKRGGGGNRGWVPCTCDLCAAIQRWFKAREAQAIRPKGAG
jgi:hypothetical protein